MNYLNCKDRILPGDMKLAAAFFSGLSADHAELLLESGKLAAPFYQETENARDRFSELKQSYSSPETAARPDALLNQNRKFIELLEKMKFEACGQPLFRQKVFHIICEQRYINTAFGTRQNACGMISVAFRPLQSFPLTCLCNQMYFWGSSAAEHPEQLLCHEDFKSIINGKTAERLLRISRCFTELCFETAAVNPPLRTAAVTELFIRFNQANNEFLGFLLHAKSGSPAVYSRSPAGMLPRAFYSELRHITSEHRHIKTLCETAEEFLKI